MGRRQDVCSYKFIHFTYALTDAGASSGSTFISTITVINGAFERLPKSLWPKQRFPQTLHHRLMPNKGYYSSMFDHLLLRHLDADSLAQVVECILGTFYSEEQWGWLR
jgi:hypothetical protein